MPGAGLELPNGSLCLVRLSPAIPGQKPRQQGSGRLFVLPSPAPLWRVCDQACHHSGDSYWRSITRIWYGRLVASTAGAPMRPLPFIGCSYVERLRSTRLYIRAESLGNMPERGAVILWRGRPSRLPGVGSGGLRSSQFTVHRSPRSRRRRQARPPLNRWPCLNPATPTPTPSSPSTWGAGG